jgi:hypothetical protein
MLFIITIKWVQHDLRGSLHIIRSNWQICGHALFDDGNSHTVTEDP